MQGTPVSQVDAFWPAGTVYGTLLNFRGERGALGERMEQPPYKAPPNAPVLYVKTANTWSASGSGIAVPGHVPKVEIGASIALVIGKPGFTPGSRGAHPSIAGYVLVNDLSVPHTSFFRPPVKAKCLDGFLGLGPQCVAPSVAGDPAGFVLEIRINRELRQTVSFADLVRNADELLADVGEFMTLREGDLLMLGCDAGRPLAQIGDRIDIHSPSVPALGTLSNTLELAVL